jgi:uncharacterized protein (TIGR02453 family)
VLPPFPGFRDEGLRFLAALRQNNDREWFKHRKAVYDDELLWPARCLVASLAGASAAAGLPFTGDPARNVFRIYRDTRFSKNKAPYKTHVGVYLTPSGSRDENGGLYVHVEPGASFFGTGWWDPDARWLAAHRARIAADPSGWLAVVEALAESGITLGPGPVPPLVRMPRGYEALKESDVAGWLRWKGAVARRDVPDAALARPNLVDDAVAFARDAEPLLDWGREL